MDAPKTSSATLPWPAKDSIIEDSDELPSLVDDSDDEGSDDDCICLGAHSAASAGEFVLNAPPSPLVQRPSPPASPGIPMPRLKRARDAVRAFAMSRCDAVADISILPGVAPLLAANEAADAHDVAMIEAARVAALPAHIGDDDSADDTVEGQREEATDTAETFTALGSVPWPKSRAKKWAFVYFITETEYEMLSADTRQLVVCFADKFRYMVYQVERSPKTSALHVQGYVATRERMTTASVAKLLIPNAKRHFYLAPARKADEANKRYCTKDRSRVSGPWEYGELDPEARQGARTDLASACALLKTDGVKAVAEQMPTVFVKYHQGFHELKKQLMPVPPKERTMEVVVLWGGPGTGKTHRALTYAGEEPIYTVSPGPHCWDSYQGEKILLIDEFDPDRWQINDMKRFLDKWRCELPCRYRNTYAAWETVIICSNQNPATWYSTTNSQDQNAFRRRLGHGCWRIQSRVESFSLMNGRVITANGAPDGSPLAAQEPKFNLMDGSFDLFMQL